MPPEVTTLSPTLRRTEEFLRPSSSALRSAAGSRNRKSRGPTANGSSWISGLTVRPADRCRDARRHTEKGIRRGHEINARRVNVRWKPCLKFSNAAERYSLSNPPHGVKVKAQVMQRVKGRRGHLAGRETDGVNRRAKSAAGVAAARRIGRTIVFGKLGVLDVDRTFASEELAISGVAGRQHAVEHVDAAGDAIRPDRSECRRPSDSGAGRPAGAASSRSTTLYIVSFGSPTLSPPIA